MKKEEIEIDASEDPSCASGACPIRIKFLGWSGLSTLPLFYFQKLDFCFQLCYNYIIEKKGDC